MRRVGARLAIALGGLCCFFSHPATAATFEPWSGPEPPPFDLPVLDGARISLADLRGQTVLVHFFASWCEPCRTELPALDRFTRRAAGQGFRVLAIAVADSEPALRRFLARHKGTIPVLLDPDRAVAISWAVDSLPATVALDGSLRPMAIAPGEVDWDDPQIDSLFPINSEAHRAGREVPPQR